jgi:hypothetical protein
VPPATQRTRSCVDDTRAQDEATVWPGIGGPDDRIGEFGGGGEAETFQGLDGNRVPLQSVDNVLQNGVAQVSRLACSAQNASGSAAARW